MFKLFRIKFGKNAKNSSNHVIYKKKCGMTPHFSFNTFDFTNFHSNFTSKYIF